MRGLSRQALRWGRLLARMALALALLLGLAAGGLAWRLAQGPLHLPMLADLLMRSGFADSLAPGLAVGDVALAWAGFHEGHRTPLELRISGLQLRDEAGAVRQDLPDAVVTLSPGWLLRGEVAPITVAVDRPSVVLERGPDGAISLAMGRRAAPTAPEGQDDLVLRRLLGQEARGTPWGILRRIDITDGRLTILDRQLGLTWRLEGVSLVLRRGAGGTGATAEGQAALQLPGQGPAVPVRLAGEVEGDGRVLQGTLSVPALEPARLAALLPALAPLALFDGSVALDLSARLDGRAPDAVPQLGLRLQAGPGGFTANGHRMPFGSLTLDATGTPTELQLSHLRMGLAPISAPSGTLPAAPPVLDATGQAALREGRWRATLNLGLDRLAAADLKAYWPPEVVRGARKWVVENVTGGAFHGGRFSLRAESGADLSGLQVTALEGVLHLERGVVHWLRPIPPLEEVQASAQFGLKDIVVQVEAARQSGTALTSPDATIRFHALDTRDEQAEIDARLRGPVAQMVALIRHPRLKLFERRPLDLKEPMGQMDGRLRLAFPLLEDIPSEALQVAVQAQLTQLHLADVVMGKTLDRGMAALTVDNSRLRATGEAQLAGIPTQLSVEMDFRPGSPTQVVERVRAEARPDARRIGEFGLDLEGFVAGPVGVQALMEKRRNGEMTVHLTGDLRESRMALTALAWRKPPGAAASARAELRVVNEALHAVESFRVEAPNLLARGQASFGPESRLDRVDVAEVRVFAGRFAVEARPPVQTGAAWRFRLSGPVLDLGPLLAEPDEAKPGAAAEDSAPVALEGRFDRVLLGEGRSLSAVQGRAGADRQGVLREARFSGRAGPQGGFDLTIVPSGRGRDLRLNAADAGALLQAFDVLRQVQGGALVVNGHWASNAPGAPLTGTAEMSDFTIQEAAGVGKLLQALTVYGVLDAVRGPGLSFARMVAPFTLTAEALTVQEARAFSPSLGVTAKGTILRRKGMLDLEGTIVPAYALNSLLGQIPLLGRLFSPEQGGGLFAATWRMRGSVQDPAVSVNPLAALTPGFLRGLFGGGAETEQPPAR